MRTITTNQRRLAYQKHLSGTHIININFPPTQNCRTPHQYPLSPSPQKNFATHKTKRKWISAQNPSAANVARSLSPLSFCALTLCGDYKLSFHIYFPAQLSCSCPSPVCSPFFLDTPTETSPRQHCCVPLSFSYAIFHAKCNMNVGKTSALLKIESYTPPPNKKRKENPTKMEGSAQKIGRLFGSLAMQIMKIQKQNCTKLHRAARGIIIKCCHKVFFSHSYSSNNQNNNSNNDISRAESKQ